jgi:hypothetical protein
MAPERTAFSINPAKPPSLSFAASRSFAAFLPFDTPRPIGTWKTRTGKEGDTVSLSIDLNFVIATMGDIKKITEEEIAKANPAKVFRRACLLLLPLAAWPVCAIYLTFNVMRHFFVPALQRAHPPFFLAALHHQHQTQKTKISAEPPSPERKKKGKLSR